MLNAHNELYKFADCLNININKKPIPSKHVNTTIVYSCGKMKRKKTVESATNEKIWHVWEIWWSCPNSGFNSFQNTLETLFELGFWKHIEKPHCSFIITARFIDYWKMTQCRIYTAQWWLKMVNEILLNGDIKIVFNNENDLTFDTFTIFHFIALKLIFYDDFMTKFVCHITTWNWTG